MPKIIRICKRCATSFTIRLCDLINGSGAYCSKQCRQRTPEQRFWTKVRKSTDGCWEWTASKDGCGYGIFHMRHGDFMHRAHRVSYALHYGAFDESLNVLHKCDNPGCVRPDHLFLGTQLDNNRDARDKGRGVYPRGENDGNSKLTSAEVLEIRRLYSSGAYMQKDLAKRFAVSKQTISAIMTGIVWRHLP